MATGRTVVLGEPDAETRRRVAALRVGWQASYEALRPAPSSQVREVAGFEAMRRAGYGDVLTVANPHSVGLQHTDEPFVDGLPFDAKDDPRARGEHDPDRRLPASRSAGSLPPRTCGSRATAQSCSRPWTNR
ncbi:MAG: hypothetical protein U1F11_04805 [Steroidobacteraceae bacterium]